MTALTCLLALLLDCSLGEPRRGHPLVLFGRLADGLEHRLNRVRGGRWAGLLALLLLVAPTVLIAALASRLLSGVWLFAVELVVLYLAIGWRSLQLHAQAVARPLVVGDLSAARRAVALLVSRDTESLDESGVATAATESVLENGADAVTASLFWYVVAGLPGVVLHRLVNTLDAMWGYRTQRFLRFGWAAARLDDVLNWVPARLTALSYALVGRTRPALRCWRRQAGIWDSPNAGPVMAAGAGALGLRLGGAARYHGAWRQRPLLGEGMAADAGSVDRALGLLQRSLLLWLLAIAVVSVLTGWLLDGAD
ncbi:adenosylcobinamide-phosphate synthase CbiB [Methylonatrum kenyense]|uniref:adenosylcobinamide-phosphate synthase CbiB n=1 Tax=Methylonatrum kenyense TaxID=455253 RepID=UPI0024A7403E|nr:adenosylcobinamide-phosphate synthase CbiB [Methylonatrum kenyense]